ncbi:MtaA/CmuA family methyltransferase [Desulfofundulus thermocisternus]|uniref:MtaA/CmuA family methyltransferase n=1 Tax=Desulfofundulus thermocisternus TaxID=42471 RepID=UPI0019E45650|nr:MtaA/CmuA family methyltransferase [Desulfofundulus thermocisternus]MBE3585948.1 MtaA/CmuA family methyltransferase [Thermoanaerobacter sp.]MCS5696854.1 MtaA/CmuA family methyltransferase [Desulfofundulus thermocisternus]
MTGRERVLKALAGEETDRLPVLSVNQTATYEQMEELNVYWPEANFRAQEMARLASGAQTILGFDAVRVPFCQTIEAEALGCPIKDGGRNNLPSPADYPYKPGDRPAMPEDYLQRGRIPELIRALKLLKEMVGDRALVIGGIIGPYSIAGSLIGATDLLRSSFKKPQLVEPFMEIGELAGRLLARELIKAGADAICIEDMMASLDMISPKIYRELVLPWQKKLLDELQDIPTIIHICGKLDDVIEDIAGLGVTAISVETKVDAPKAVEKLKKFGRHIPLIGGVDAAHTLFSGNIDKVKEEVRKAIDDGYNMIAPGCSIPPATPTACLRAMVDEVIGYSQ